MGELLVKGNHLVEQDGHVLVHGGRVFGKADRKVATTKGSQSGHELPAIERILRGLRFQGIIPSSADPPPARVEAAPRCQTKGISKFCNFEAPKSPQHPVPQRDSSPCRNGIIGKGLPTPDFGR